MGGITGFWHLDKRPAEQHRLDAMIAGMQHRGRGSRGKWLDQEVALAWLSEARSIAGSSPEEVCTAADASCRLVIDGRIDNLAALRRELAASTPAGVRAHGQAELVLRSYHTWGLDCFRRLIGDFAVALFDGDKEQLILARDPMDARGLFYAYDSHTFQFASELACITNSTAAGVSYPLNTEYFVHFILTLPCGQLTPFQGIHRVPPGYIVTVDAAEVRQIPYWKPASAGAIRHRQQADYVEHFRSLFEEAVRCRLPGSGKVGVTLSGGLDSGSIGCMASQLVRTGQTQIPGLLAISYRFDSPEADEREYIAANAAQMGVAPCYIEAEPYFRRGDRDAVREATFFPEPQDSFNVHLMHAALTTAGELGIGPLLCGHFGDDLFAHNVGMLRDFFMQGRWRVLSQHLAAWAEPMRSTPVQLFAQSFRGLDADFPARWLMHSTMLDQLQARFQWHGGHINHAQRIALQYLMLDRTDLGYSWYAAYGLDNRLPFKDRRLVEYCLAIPREQLHHLRTTKLILREAMRGILPDQVRERRTKSGELGLAMARLRGECSNLEGLWQRYGDVLSFLDGKAVLDALRRTAYGDTTHLRAVFRLATALFWLAGQDQYRPTAPFQIDYLSEQFAATGL